MVLLWACVADRHAKKSVADAIAAAKAKIAAKLAGFKANAVAPTGSALGNAAPSAAAASSSQNADSTGSSGQPKSTADAIAEARRKIEAMKAKAAKNANPYLVRCERLLC